MNIIVTAFLLSVLAPNIFARPNDKITDNISFLYFYGEEITSYATVPYEDGLSILEQDTYNISACTIFHFPGFNEKASLMSKGHCPTIVIPELLKHTDCNIIVINYENLVINLDNGTSYKDVVDGVYFPLAVINSYKIANVLSIYFTDFIKLCDCGDRMHLIGNSLGAQIMSYTGKDFNKANPYKFHHMTGLDPAGPRFYTRHLEPSDANFVDVIHTDVGGFGTIFESGHVDFWPNGGKAFQPGCTASSRPICSHVIACNYYANSIKNRTFYPSQACPAGYAAWDAGLCNSEPEAYMGYGVKHTDSGNYYLNTEAYKSDEIF